jgi:hypothetical protein
LEHTAGDDRQQFAEVVVDGLGSTVECNVMDQVAGVVGGAADAACRVAAVVVAVRLRFAHGIFARPEIIEVIESIRAGHKGLAGRVAVCVQ